MRLCALLLLFLLASCAVGPDGSYDPNLYDANGHVVPPLAAAQPPPPPPPPPAPECREVETTVMIGGKPAQASAMACRQSDGSWRFMN